MIDKVKLPKDAAEAIENMRAKGAPLNEIVERHVFKDHNSVNGWESVQLLSTDTLIRALYIGYEVEQTPEDKVREYYHTPKEYGAIINDAIDFVLDTLRIKIKGVND